MGKELRTLLRALRVTSLAAALTAGAWVQVSPSFAATDPYLSLSSGFDASYPQGSAAAVPSGFGVIGVTHGRPFTADSSATSLWDLTMSNGTGNGSLYFNTGYALAYAKSETPNCASAATVQVPGAGHTVSALQKAWAIGCSEADYAVGHEPSKPTMWWADIETGNSWSNNTSLNDATITGIVYELGQAAPTIPVGVYSSASMWTTIAGSLYFNDSIGADWVAGSATCSTPGFTLDNSGNAPIWLLQSGTWSVNRVSFDKDTAC